jgi:ABC-type cobalamin/Fe3+-siderophores transport system ATPase subunit
VWLLQQGELKAAGEVNSVLDTALLGDVFDCEVNSVFDATNQRYFSTTVK